MTSGTVTSTASVAPLLSTYQSSSASRPTTSSVPTVTTSSNVAYTTSWAGHSTAPAVGSWSVAPPAPVASCWAQGNAPPPNNSSGQGHSTAAATVYHTSTWCGPGQASDVGAVSSAPGVIQPGHDDPYSCPGRAPNQLPQTISGWSGTEGHVPAVPTQISTQIPPQSSMITDLAENSFSAAGHAVGHHQHSGGTTTTTATASSALVSSIPVSSASASSALASVAAGIKVRTVFFFFKLRFQLYIKTTQKSLFHKSLFLPFNNKIPSFYFISEN